MKHPFIGGIDDDCKVLLIENGYGIAIEHPTIEITGVPERGRNNSSFKNITREYLDNTYGKVESKEHAEFIVELCRIHGIPTIYSSKPSEAKSFEVNKGYISLHSIGINELNVSSQKLITIPLPPKQIQTATSEEEFEMQQIMKNNGDNLVLGCEEVKKEKLFAGVARIGNGKYRSRNGGKKIKCYKVWEGMITRCYVESSQHYQRYGGRGVYVCDEWLNYQNFAEWYLNQKNNSKSNFQIDKDLKVIGNKVYSPEACEIVPSRVNSLLISTNSRRGDLPVGVHALKDKFKASCRDEFGSKVHLGTFKTQTEAFSAYKNFKKGVIVCIANDELKKGNISSDVHRSLVLMEINPFPE